MQVDADDLKARVDLADLVTSRGVELRKSGSQFVGLCPLHDERSPSFYVRADRGFHCFGCGARGDAIRFLMLSDRVDFEEALRRLAEFVGVSSSDVRREPKRNPEPPSRQPSRDAAAIWERLALHDDEGEGYLSGRGILPWPIPTDVLRFNVPGASGDEWLDARAREGYRVAFAARDVRGHVQTLSLRHVGPDEPPAGKKALALAGCPTAGAAIVLPGVTVLAGAEPEFAFDEVHFVEGGTSWLGAELHFVDYIANGEIKPIWTLGVIGVASVESVVRAFAPVLRWRTVLLGFDRDEAGESATVAATFAAQKAGAREVLRMRPPDGAKDWAVAATKAVPT